MKRAPIGSTSNEIRNALAEKTPDGTPFFYELSYATSEVGARKQLMRKVLDQRSKDLIKKYGFDLLVKFVPANDEFNAAKVDFWRYSIARGCKVASQQR